MGEEIKIPLKDLIKLNQNAISSKKGGFPIQKIRCRLKDPEKLLPKLISTAYPKLCQQGDIDYKDFKKVPQNVDHNHKTMYIYYKGLEEGKELTAREIREEFSKTFGKEQEIPSEYAIDFWRKGEVPKRTEWGKIVMNCVDGKLSENPWHVGNKYTLGCFQYREGKHMLPLDTLLFLAHDICGMSVDDIQDEIEYLRVGGKDALPKIINCLFSWGPLTEKEISSEIKVYKRKFLNGFRDALNGGYIEQVSIYYRLAGDKRKRSG